MGKLSRITALVLACAAGCGKRSTVEQHAGRGVQTARGPAETAREREPGLYDAQGQLLASGDKVYWLPLPRGFEKSDLSLPRHLAFESHKVSVDRVRAYLSRYMLTGEVIERGESVRYNAVMPLHGDASDQRFDVSVSAPSPGKTVLRIDLLSYAGVRPLSVQQAKTVLAKERAQAE